MIICVTGTPGTGKTGIAKRLAETLDLEYIDVNSLIKKNKLHDGYDKKRKCYIVDEKKLAKAVIKEIGKIKKTKQKKACVIDSHLSHYLPPKYVDFCVVTVCEISVLKMRLESRGYSKEKIKENLESEIFRVCENEARELGHKVIVCDTTESSDIEKLIDKMKSRRK